MKTLEEVASELARRLTRIFLRDADGKRPIFGSCDLFNHDPNWRDFVPFYEYFHGDTGRGCGASHQTGWTALVVRMLENRARTPHEQAVDQHAAQALPKKQSLPTPT